jgi:hypothetical protein
MCMFLVSITQNSITHTDINEQVSLVVNFISYHVHQSVYTDKSCSWFSLLESRDSEF